MKIIIENKEAVLKKGASFDYISENRFFTGADGYTLSITFKFTFKFLVKDGKVPDVRSVFFIHGKKYLVESITASFNEDGMSQLCKMVAYRINS